MGTTVNPALAELHNFIGDQDPQAEASWLGSHGMLHDVGAPYEVVTNKDWDRPGSQTYVLEFSINERGRSMASYVMKACLVAPATETLEEWVARRRFLEGYGICAPRLHAVKRGTLIEEFIPYGLKEAYTSADNATKETLRTGFTATYHTILTQGFRPLSFHDVRSRGNDVVLVDFGSDLGGIPRDPIIPDSLLIGKQASEELGRILGKALLT